MFTKSFYRERQAKTEHAAKSILAIVSGALPALTSAVDFGCASGTWLAELRRRGVNDVLGLDGEWVHDAALEIPSEHFQHTDLRKKVALDKRYDLALCLEVAEHLSAMSAEPLVDSLVEASDFVLFSAAIPFQGGNRHINEQWPEYWAELFRAHDYVCVDFIRRSIWEDRAIPTCYRQNIRLYVRSSRKRDLKEGGDSHQSPPATIHPDLYASRMAAINSVSGSWRLFMRSLRRALSRYLRNDA